jgi:hypothetical protein
MEFFLALIYLLHYEGLSELLTNHRVSSANLHELRTGAHQNAIICLWKNPMTEAILDGCIQVVQKTRGVDGQGTRCSWQRGQLRIAA